MFTYANDLWMMPKDGGAAVKLSSPAGVESFPKFSPDGKSIAFTGNYDGNKDVYVIPATVVYLCVLHSMVIQTVWLTGHMMAKKFCLLRQEKVGKQDSTNFIPFQQPADP